MVARGILQNPAMFAGFSVTPKECISNWVNTVSCQQNQFVIVVRLLDFYVPFGSGSIFLLPSAAHVNDGETPFAKT